jgi:D-mannonate dehydratase
VRILVNRLGTHLELMVLLAKSFAERINFLHLRNVNQNAEGDFLEGNTLDGDIDIYSVMKMLLIEQKRRLREERQDHRLPMRPDHGHLMLPDQHRTGIYPGVFIIWQNEKSCRITRNGGGDKAVFGFGIRRERVKIIKSISK